MKDLSRRMTIRFGFGKMIRVRTEVWKGTWLGPECDNDTKDDASIEMVILALGM